MADWSELTKDVLELITSKLELPDYHRFGAVCQNWHSAAKSKHYPVAKQLPWLILGEDVKTKKRVFFNLSENKHYHIDIPELYGHVCLGSSYGWVFTVDKEIDGHLLNPLTRERYNLPIFPAYNKHYTIEYAKALQGKKRYRMQCEIVIKAILSSNPSESQDFTLVIIFGIPPTVAFWRPGDSSWTLVECSLGRIQDITYFKGKLYGLVGCYTPVVIDLGPNPKMTWICPSVPSDYRSKEAYLVDFDGEFLILIQRIQAEQEGFKDLDDMEEGERTKLLQSYSNDDYDEDEHRHFVTKELLVFELDLEEEKFYELASIDNFAFFLGRGSLVVVDPTQVPGCVPNRISYSGVMNEYGGFDQIGFYDMVSGTVGEYNTSKQFIPHSISPTWFIPNPW